MASTLNVRAGMFRSSKNFGGLGELNSESAFRLSEIQSARSEYGNGQLQAIRILESSSSHLGCVLAWQSGDQPEEEHFGIFTCKLGIFLAAKLRAESSAIRQSELSVIATLHSAAQRSGERSQERDRTGQLLVVEQKEASGVWMRWSIAAQNCFRTFPNGFTDTPLNFWSSGSGDRPLATQRPTLGDSLGDRRSRLHLNISWYWPRPIGGFCNAQNHWLAKESKEI